MRANLRHAAIPLVGGLVVFSALIPVQAASAAAIHDVANEAALRTVAATAAAGDTIRLTGDIGSGSARIDYLAFESSATLDLNGFALVTQSIVLKPGVDFTIDDRSADGDGLLDALYVDRSGVPYGASAAISTSGAHLAIAGGNIVADAGTANSRAGIGGYPTSAATPQGVLITGGTIEARAIGGAGVGTSQNDIAVGNFPIQIEGGTVTASSNFGAGIGSAGRSSYAEPVITVTGGVIDASSVTGAGIGGGERVNTVSSINISDISISGGAAVIAHSTQAAGIGGGNNGSAKSLTIGEGADVTASSGNPLVPAVGAGLTGSRDGSLAVNGTLRIPANSFVRSKLANPLGSVVNTIGATGVITGEGGLRAQGVWNNSGAITLPDSLITALDINVHHFKVALNGNRAGAPNSTARVFASTFANGDRVLPVLSASGGWRFTGWNTAADGSGAVFTADTAMSPGPEVGGVDGTAVGLFAQWAPARIEIAATPGTSVAGNSIALSAQCFGIGDVPLGDCTDGVTFTSSVASDVLTEDSVLVKQAGTHTYTGTGWGLSATTTATVTAAAASQLQLTPSSASVGQFGELSFVSTLLDEYGNWVSDVSATAVLTSAPAGVQVDGNKVTFPSEGSFTVRSTQGQISATAAIEVTAAPLESLVLTAPPTAVAGDTLTLSAEGFASGGHSLGDYTDRVTFSSSEAGDDVVGDQAAVSRAGERTFTATLIGDPEMVASARTEVRAGEVAELRLQASTPQVSEGSSVIFSSTAVDAHGNVTDVTSSAVLSSDNSHDIVDGNTVTFPTASRHVVTSTFDGMKASVTINVIPSPGTPVAGDAAALSKTGTDSSFVLGLGVLMLMLGSGATATRLLLRRRAGATEA